MEEETEFESAARNLLYYAAKGLLQERMSAAPPFNAGQINSLMSLVNERVNQWGFDVGFFDGEDEQ